MKRLFLFLPDIFFVMLIVFSCERADLSEWRQPRDYFLSENPMALNNLDMEMSFSERERWVDLMEEYRGKAVSFLHHWKGRVSDSL
ncbi:MAG: hypothetical protein JJU34_05965 [Lunatimonas sp.]|uniref:hypothetical protein n=1 Tax=Lunatimonas sp. TaxID=2060141 RepID=UPI00263B437F|nr:hypothetical protein [Lunatimonas sp.]MCC5936807.1 hypothetical protein [Lunatimonas sp.]